MAPWCVWLDNLELAVLLLAQPWIGGGGLRRADMERQLARLAAADLLVGPVYFQRIKRAVAALEHRGQLAGVGAGRRQGFVITPEGFAALILNLQVLRADPTVDGTEFELKRTLVAMWNLVLERLLAWPDEIDPGPGPTELFRRLDSLEVWGRRVITDSVVEDGLNILRLVKVQRERVHELRQGSELRLTQTRAQAEMSRGAKLSRLFPFSEGTFREIGPGRIIEAVRSLAAGAMPRLEAMAKIERYTAYLRYLDSLEELYSGELRLVDIGAFRSALAGRAG